MAGIALEDMLAGPRRFRPSWRSPSFPTDDYCCGWDLRNAGKLERSAAHTVPGPHADEMLELASLLRPDLKAPVPTSMASARYRREITDRVCSQLWRTTDALVEPPHFFTAIPDYGDVPLADLSGLDPETMTARFRTALNEHGAGGSEGILFAVVEGEYQTRTTIMRAHMHGIASGQTLAAVDALRDTRAFYSPRRQKGEPKPEVAYRIKISRRPLFNLPDPLTYCIKHWYARWVSPEGKRGSRLRLPNDAAVEALLWQHSHTISEVSLLMGLRPGRRGFQL